MPQEYQKKIINKYKEFTSYDIETLSYEKMGDIKKRGAFETNIDGCDSNTISAGEDNLMIILTAIYSLVYFSESLKEDFKNIPGILLIDELDATLHPEFQAMLLRLIKDITDNYENINVVFTTHGLSMMRECDSNNVKIIYLQDNITRIDIMEEPTEHKIQAALENKLRRDYFTNTKIPILTEDAEARDFLNTILDYFKKEEPYKSDCLDALQHINLIDASFSCESLNTLFQKSNIDKKYIPLIAILDGDQKLNYPKNHIISLPGNLSPENIAFNVCKSIIDRQNEPLCKELIKRLENNYSCSLKYIKTKIIKRIDNIDEKIAETKIENKTTSGMKREYNKKLYKEYQEIFKEFFKFWVLDEQNKKDIEKFYNNFKICYNLVGPIYGINFNIK